MAEFFLGLKCRGEAYLAQIINGFDDMTYADIKFFLGKIKFPRSE
jgi:hypothetical protein